MNQLNAIKVFRRVVELNSFSAAARELGLSNAAISKNISDLELYLGAQLLVRTTRRVSVTEVGDDYYRKCGAILQDLNEADLSAGSSSVEPRGRLRVNAPMSFGILHVAPLISEFLSQYQNIEVDLVLNDNVVDLLEGDFDVALRIGGALRDSSLISKRLASIERVVCASPEYFDQAGHPNHPTDLQAHRCLSYSLSSSPGNWVFTKEADLVSIEVTGPLTANNSIALREALIAGVGISLIPTFIVGKELFNGELVQTLQAYKPAPQSLYAVYPQTKYLAQKVRTFIDFISNSIDLNLSWGAP